MKVIQNAAAETDAICGRQKTMDNCIYRLTKHCVETHCDKGRLLFHTLTGMLILLEKDQNPDECREHLIRHWFLVPTEFDDVAFADKVLHIVKLLRKNADDKAVKKFFTILTSTHCNARCYYCYESDVPRYSMTPNTAVDVGDYITRVSGSNEVELRWFGGEPLFNFEAIDLICKRLSENGVNFKSLMISNGYYLDSSMLEKAVSLWKLKKVQITLDGTRETYNRVKSYVNAEPDAYTRVMQNIENALTADVEVYIRLNTCAQNVDEMIKLADELAIRFMRFKGTGKLFVYPAVLVDFRDAKKPAIENGIEDSLLRIKEKLKAHGLDRKPPSLESELKNNHCKADNDDCEIILPDGRLCKCEHMLENDCHGSIYTEKRDFKRIEAWKQQIKLPECFACPLYPRCINLKQCVWVKDNCSKGNRTLVISALKEQILAAYNDRKE